MNIKGLTTKEKSVMLATAAGWITRVGIAYAFRPPVGMGEYYDHLATLQHYRADHVCPDLYDPINMALAWGVLNWASTNRIVIDYCMEYGFMEDIRTYWAWPPAEAQTKWLDGILEIAVQAGLTR